MSQINSFIRLCNMVLRALSAFERSKDVKAAE